MFSEHDDWPADAAAQVDQGLDEANLAAAPLHEVQRLSVIARDPAGQVIGGALGRRWGQACELQQLWVHPGHRHRGLGGQLVRRFEARARARGVTQVYLETWSFQAPDFYRALGYRETHRLAHFPHGLIKFVMEHGLDAPGPGASAPPPSA